MALLTGPLLSLEAHGSVGGVITYRVNKRRKQAETTPFHADAKTYSQLNQRIKYLTATHEWNWLTPLEKAVYIGLSKRKNITGFNVMMSRQLKLLRQGYVHQLLLARHRTAATIADKSGYGLTATRYGTSYWEGLLGGSILFDGIDDYLSTPHNAALDFPLNNFSIELLIFLTTTGIEQTVMQKRAPATTGYVITIGAPNRIALYLEGPNGYCYRQSATPLKLAQWYHVMFSVDRANDNIDCYINGALDNGAFTKSAGWTPTQNIGNTSNIIWGYPAFDFLYLHGALDLMTTWQHTIDLRIADSRYAIPWSPFRT